MSLPTKTLDAIIKRVLAHFRTSFRGWPLGTEAFLGRSARAVGLSTWQLHGALEQIDADIVPSAQSSDDILSAWAEELGLPDGEGGYGRSKPVAASGGVGLLTGIQGTVYPLGAVATAEDGTTQIQLTAVATIPGSPPGLGSVSGSFTAITKGTVGNLPVGSKLTWETVPSGADPTFELTSALGYGLDTEDNSQVFSRIVARLQAPPRGGITEDYHLWAQTVPGVTNVYVFPKRSGTGTVDVVITVGGTGQARLPSAGTLALVEEAINNERPVGAEAIQVMAPLAPDANGHVVKVRVVPFSDDYEFDWDDTAASYTVDTYTAGAPATLKLNTLAPQSLKTAIDTYLLGAGTAPRLQVISTGSVINEPIRAVAYSDGGGQTTLTLETLPDDWVPPTAGDLVFAYGPVVETIAGEILVSVDALGPSRACGFADEILPWDDKITISGIIAAAQNAVASDGSSLIEEVPVGGATIDGVVADVQGEDQGTPELLWLEHIIITQ